MDECWSAVALIRRSMPMNLNEASTKGEYEQEVERDFDDYPTVISSAVVATPQGAYPPLPSFHSAAADKSFAAPANQPSVFSSHCHSHSPLQPLQQSVHQHTRSTLFVSCHSHSAVEALPPSHSVIDHRAYFHVRTHALRLPLAHSSRHTRAAENSSSCRGKAGIATAGERAAAAVHHWMAS